MATYTSKELKMLEAALDSANDNPRWAEFNQLRRECQRERYARRNPEWSAAITRAYRDYDTARKLYFGQLKQVEDALGWEARGLIEGKLQQEEPL